MDKFFLAIACIAVLGVLFALFNGLRAMARGSEEDHKLSQKMMQMRVICQAIALVSLFLAYAAKH